MHTRDLLNVLEYIAQFDSDHAPLSPINIGQLAAVPRSIDVAGGQYIRL
jgi:hypothetical protein